MDAQSASHRRVILKRAIEEEDWCFLGFTSNEDFKKSGDRMELLRANLTSSSCDQLMVQDQDKFSDDLQGLR